MFGQMKAQPIIRVTPSTLVGDAVDALITATDKAQPVRWIEFPAALLLFVIVPGDSQSGAFYVLDRRSDTWPQIEPFELRREPRDDLLEPGVRVSPTREHERAQLR